MIYGIGVDLVQVSRIQDALNRWGDRFVGRVFTAAEAEMCLRRAAPGPCFALRFGAKEAFSKALGTGMRSGVRWKDIEVFHYPGGRPGLKIHGMSSEICRKERITRIHLSLSDERGYGVAMVVLEQEDETGRLS
jgi:holo-[acyl-carrier protein] synthase